MQNWIISIKPRFADMIISGHKTVEIRNRPVRMSPGDRLWIYSTAPKREICALATVKEIDIDTMGAIWQRHSVGMGISKEELLNYGRHCNEISAILLTDVGPLTDTPGIVRLRIWFDGFVPPPSYRRATEVEATAFTRLWRESR